MIAGQGVFHCETASTYALLWQSIGPPSKPQADSIPECRFMKVKAMLSYRQDRQLVECTLFSSQVDHSLDIIRKLFKQENNEPENNCSHSVHSSKYGKLYSASAWMKE